MHYTDGAHFLQKTLEEHGYCSIIINTGTETEDMIRSVETLERRRVEGAVLVGSSFATGPVQISIQQHLSSVPIVMINGYLDLPNIYGVLSDEQNGVMRCVDLLMAKGHKKIAYAYEALSPSGKLKKQGYIEGMKSHGESENLWIYGTESTLQGGYTITKKIITAHPDVEGIIYSIDLIAAGGARALSDSGMAIPEQVAVIGIDNCLYGEICTPQLTSLDNKLLDSSIMGARALVDCLEGRKTVKKIMVYSSIVEREST